MESLSLNRMSESNDRVHLGHEEDQSDYANEESALIMLAMESNNKYVKENVQKLSDLNQELSQRKEEYRCQILHIETITMMAKYQLIYIKMENFWKKLERLFTNKFYSHKMDALEVMKKKLVDPKANKRYVFLKFRSGMDSLVKLLELREVRLKSQFFGNIHYFSLIGKSLSKERERIHSLQDNLEKVKKDIKQVKSKLNEESIRSYHKKRSLKDKGKKKMTDKEKKEITSSIEALKEYELMSADMSQRLKLTENKVIRFIQEMSVSMKETIDAEKARKMTGGGRNHRDFGKKGKLMYSDATK